MKRFTRMAALLLFGLMAAVNVSADDAENKWEWIGEEIVTGGKEFYIFNVKSNTFINNSNEATATDFFSANTFSFWGEATKATISNSDDWRLRLNSSSDVKVVKKKSGFGSSSTNATTFTISKSSTSTYAYKFSNNITIVGTRYFTVDGNKYTAGKTSDKGNDWILFDPNKSEQNQAQFTAYKNNYAAYAAAYAAAKAYKDVAMPATTKNKLTDVLAKETTYENVVANTQELNDVVAEIKALTYTVNISDNYATVCLDFNATVPAGVAAYRLDSYDADKANMTLKKCAEEGDVLPAGQGFVLHTDNAAAADYSFNFADDKTPATIDTNLLGGTTEETTQDGSKYYWVISNSPATGKVGFFILNETTNIPAHKAYFAVDRSSVNLSNCNMFSFDDNTTGISAATASKNATIIAIYNAAGKQQTTLSKGLNIVKMSDGSVKKIMK